MDGKLRNMTAIYISRGEEMLMLYRVGSRVVSPSWCGIGGHFEPGELNDAKACALRELQEEAGLRECDLDNLTMRYVTLRLKNSEIRQNYYFFADLREGVSVKLASDEGRLQWIPYDQVMDREMPFTAYYMLQHYLTVGRYTDPLYAGITTEDGVEFTPLREF